MYRFNMLKLRNGIVQFLYLNTTNVSVQYYFLYGNPTLVSFKYNKCIGSMKMAYHLQKCEVGFKYNKCIGSIVLDKGGRGTPSNLNTTNVSVQ